MAALYTTRLWAGELSDSSGRARLFTVPAGRRVVITDVHGQLQTTTTVRLLLFLNNSGTPLIRVDATSTAPQINWAGRVVLHEGEWCEGSAQGGTRFGLHGWLLDGGGGPVGLERHVPADPPDAVVGGGPRVR